MNKRIVMGIAILAMAGTAVQAAIITAAGTGNWTNAATWTGGVIPGTVLNGADIARIGSSRTVTLDSALAQPLGNVQVGRTTAGTLTLNSGAFLGMLSASSLTVGESGGVGTFVMNGGTITGRTVTVSQTAVSSAGSSAAIHGGTMTLDGVITAGKAAAGSITMDGGSILASRLSVGDAGNLYVGTTALTGGTIELTSAATNALYINSVAGSKLTMGGDGTLIINGNNMAQIDTYVTGGDIVWSSGSADLGYGQQTWDNGGSYFLHAEFVGGKTTVWANTIPEPATMGMLLLGAVTVLAVRRHPGRIQRT